MKEQTDSNVLKGKVNISFHKTEGSKKPRFTILIPSWNNLDYLKCCVNSILKNSSFDHQIVVHVNEGTDGTLEWAKEQKFTYTHSIENVGVCYGFNAPATLADADFLVFSDDDFYYAPQWDEHLWEAINQVGHDYFCLSATMIEHSPTNYNCIIAPHDFGKSVKEFDEKRFLEQYRSIPFQDWMGSNWYPLVLHKKVWNLIGGLSTEFTPGMGSDPDMMMKLWHLGVRYFRGVSASRVYHFTSRSTSRVKKNDGNKQFLLKWGLSKSTFFDFYLKMGQPFSGLTPEFKPTNEAKKKLFRDRLKRLFAPWG
jgi:glycosyltransferase involved in cell wall biosynthesis